MKRIAFSKLPVGSVFRIGDRVYRKTEAVYAPKRGYLQYNARNAQTGEKTRLANHVKVEVVTEAQDGKWQLRTE
jgi:hypothetical protein